MTKKAEDYEWSSAGAHLSGIEVSGCLDMSWWRETQMQARWAEVLVDAQERKAELDAIRQATFTGRPLGSKEFVAGLERQLSRRLSAVPGGRPKLIRQDGGMQMR